ncbi:MULTISPECIES: histidinol-phosphate transaminase [unclassified Arsukibacterium]|uniref:histidinol-phosphate transaminase n=1 Tax=unclassified Arsukibacterium TaxID=2635278 RepID=UPI000C5C069E|nr:MULTISPECIES: histidinol-phosphate transaminase [unclassified Arsukibacterium]MAA93360.1 histidinol-phosphate transaminase [Rheinheimera sp.]MBM35302.1 histidinol-phosphate transaminase [Rheinheimera sp.]HAW91882.1 histidinol-phosphate transaminase [Candidatus Azambacteria bacterium]|tara:strand:+ start:36330 stop:37430 length:1101 start_codon:yes stop_codon:yes gene_type:complete
MTEQNGSAVNTLARKLVKDLVPYASARSSMSGGAVWLNANENALAPAYQLDGTFNRYPSCQPKAVINAYAAYAGVKSEQVLVSRGADEGIELLIRSFCEPNTDSITICPPTYGMYAISAQSHQTAVNKVLLLNSERLDLDGIFATNPKLVFICSPNNPTGDVIPHEQIIAVLEHFKNSALVVVDEAYIEFVPEASVAPLLNRYPHLVVLRTLSKAFGLAGLRCGFTLANPDVINALRKMIAPYPIAEPVAQIAAQALSAAGIAQMKQSVATINTLRSDFIKLASTLPGVLKVWPSNANYVLLQVADAADCVNALIDADILIRNQSSQLGLTQVVRVSIGSPDEMQRLTTAMQQYFLTNQQIKREHA